MKHFYESIPGWFNYEWLYKRMVENASSTEPTTFVEVGTWLGKSAAYLAVEIINSGKLITLYCIDHFKGSKEHYDKTHPAYNEYIDKHKDIFLLTFKNLSPVLDVVRILPVESKVGALFFDDASVDFCFIDASHEYEDVLNDIQSWSPKVKRPEGLWGHDIGWPGVKQAVNTIGHIVEHDCWRKV